MCIISIQRSKVKDVHYIYSAFKSEETCVERYLHLSRIYSELKDVHPIYSSFKSEETCVERYLHLSRIYSEVNDVHPIYSTSKSQEAGIEGYLYSITGSGSIEKKRGLFTVFPLSGQLTVGVPPSPETANSSPPPHSIFFDQITTKRHSGEPTKTLASSLVQTHQKITKTLPETTLIVAANKLSSSASEFRRIAAQRCYNATTGQRTTTQNTTPNPSVFSAATNSSDPPIH
ncbi:hypothetical protein H5410_057047 [Solanum commersonii]|uniref:Uncharacterized protein n=1 Tax=Solanum commersonii TaxID=4109 RepID=A0A9J5WLW2_SOLCO|nr:hypothetical protein H5410_057047 [Solanum commersonii]